MCRRRKRRIASGAPASGSACSRSARPTPIGSRDCCTRRGLAMLRTGDGRALAPRLKEEIVREHERLCLVNKQLAELEAKSKAELRRAAPGSAEAKIVQLIDLRGIGPASSQKLVNEVFYRSFANRRQVGSCF